VGGGRIAQRGLPRRSSQVTHTHTLLSKLINLGVINPSTYRMTLVEFAAAESETLEQVEDRFKQALKKGAPLPSREVVANWGPEAKVTFKLVTDAVNSMFRHR
jgi:hypothetical protein